MIDEQGLYKISGKNDTDHNSIVLNINIPDIERIKRVKTTIWNLKATREKWDSFAQRLRDNKGIASTIISDTNQPFDKRYKDWFKMIEEDARNTIGKTTIREGKGPKPSKEVKELQEKRKLLKAEIQKTKEKAEKETLIAEYKTIQMSITHQIVKEKTQILTEKFEKIANDKSRKLFWKEKKNISRNPALESLVVKDATGIRQYQPEAIKAATANYYENLYKMKFFPPHPYHQEVNDQLQQYERNFDYEELDYNAISSKHEVKQIIERKKNNKSTPDIRNEMLKSLAMLCLISYIP